MSQTERRRIARYIRSLANTLGLRDWTINIQSDEPDTKEAFASVSCVYGRRIAHVWLAHGFEDLDADTQRHVLLHELLHVHLDGVLALSAASLPDLLGLGAYSIYEAALRERVEHGVDAIADALASALPLP
jgi:hypothetical protein